MSNKKFIDEIKIDNWEILTDDGFVDLVAIHKTIKYKKWKLKTEFSELNCANDHIVFVNNFQEKFVKDLNLNDIVITKNGHEHIIEVTETPHYINMYDAEINHYNHRYYTNGILSHNSSTAFILAKDTKDLYINASTDSGVDTIRDRIEKFALSTDVMSSEKKIKCVILDEMDFASEKFYAALRAVMERYAAHTRFIATCNHPQKIPDEVKSRFYEICYDPIDKKEEEYVFNEYIKRAQLILKAAKISYTDEILNKFIKLYYPDMRKIMDNIHAFYIRKISVLDQETFNTTFDFNDLFKQCLLKPDKPYNNYKELVGQYSMRVDEALAALGNSFPEYLMLNAPDKINKLPMVLIATAEYQYQKAFVIDPVVTFLALVYKIQTILT